MTTIMLVDDQELIRAGLRTIIDASPDLDVVAEAGDGITAIRLLADDEVDVILLDLNMPGMDGVETVRRVRAGGFASRILILTTFDQDQNVLAALRAGADGFLSKGASPSDIVDGISKVAAGEHALSATAIHTLVQHAAAEPVPVIDSDKAALFEHLTAREREVVSLIASGLDNIEIGRRIFISPFTVKTHANRAMTKVGARDRAQLVLFAIQAGL